MSTDILLNNASAVGFGPTINVNKAIAVTFVIEFSPDFVPFVNPVQGSWNTAIFIEEIEASSDVPAVINPNPVASYQAVDGAQNPAGTKVIFHPGPGQGLNGESHWLSFRARVVNAPQAGTISIRLYT